VKSKFIKKKTKIRLICLENIFLNKIKEIGIKYS